MAYVKPLELLCIPPNIWIEWGN